MVITEPAIGLTSTNAVTPLGCTIKGAVTINAKDGWGSYTYTLTTPTGTVITQSTNYFGDLSDTSGAYTTSVADVNGCTITDTFTLTVPVNPIAAIDVTSDYCYDGTNAATLVVKASLGVAPYFFSIDNGLTFAPSNTLPVPDDTYTFSNLTSGSYDVVVKDAYGCLSLLAVNTVIEPQLFATAVKTKEVFCIAPIDGTIKITATGGYGPYSYKVSTDGVTFPGVAIPFTNPTDTDFSVPSSATTVSYVFEITDSKGCIFVTTPPVIMVPPTPVDLVASDIDITGVDCNAPQGTFNNGSITVNLRAVNDNPDYSYTLTPILPAGPAITQATNVFTGLVAGDYTVTVTSGRGCDVTLAVNVPAPLLNVTASATVAAFSCAVDPTKTTAVVIGGGGTGTYSFSADGINYFTSNTLPVADNKYTFDLDDTGLIQNPTYFVKDSNGCIQTNSTFVYNSKSFAKINFGDSY